MRIDCPSERHFFDLRRIWKEAFGDSDEAIDAFWRTAFSPNRARIALMDDAPVAALYWFECTYHGQRLAYLYAIATDRSFRGRGICKQLMEDTHRHLKYLGYAGALLVPSEHGLFDFYRKMGYETCSAVEDFDCTGEERELLITPIDKAEYATLRRTYLPIGGVIQEGETLDFLEMWEQFWKGEDFLLTGHRIGDCLIGAELLGNVAAASRIVHVLGCKRGSFRTVGACRPFAMYHPFDNTYAPTYFGLALD